MYEKLKHNMTDKEKENAMLKDQAKELQSKLDNSENICNEL